MAAVTTARGTCNSVPNCVLSSNRLLWRAQEVFIHCIMMILVAGAVPLIYSFHINLHNIMWEEHIFGVPTSVVTNGFYPALEELCLRVSCWDLQGQRVTHSSQLDLCQLGETLNRDTVMRSGAHVRIQVILRPIIIFPAPMLTTTCLISIRIKSSRNKGSVITWGRHVGLHHPIVEPVNTQWALHRTAEATTLRIMQENESNC